MTGPEGRWGVSFDDGPSPNSPTLYNFLESMNQSATHFMIGGNILSNPGGEFSFLPPAASLPLVAEGRS